MKRALVVIGADSSVGRAFLSDIREDIEAVILTVLDITNELKLAYLKLKDKYKSIELSIYKLNVLDTNAIQKCFDEITSVYYIQYLLYFVGKNHIAPAIEISQDLWDEILGVNLRGFFFCAQAAGRNMIENEGGAIVCISSQHGIVANINRASYCASKAGLLNLVRELALEWAKYSVRVNAISPTFIEHEETRDYLNQSNHFRQENKKKIPLRSYVKSSEVAEAVHFLLSKSARMMTGSNIVMDGGWTIQ